MNTRIVERSILHYTNKERRKRKLRALRGHNALIRAARGHSRWMARRNKMSHTGGSGSEPWDRAERAGYPSGNVSENLWQSSGSKGLAYKSKLHWRSDWQLGRVAVISWMNSSGHRQNLLTPNIKHIGIGVARNKRGSIYLTQKFGNPTWGITSVDNKSSSRLVGWLQWAIGLALFFVIAGICSSLG